VEETRTRTRKLIGIEGKERRGECVIPPYLSGWYFEARMKEDWEKRS
jgi:hypothetical protein